ncbi:MAG: porin [Endozoicomonas sp.]
MSYKAKLLASSISIVCSIASFSSVYAAEGAKGNTADNPNEVIPELIPPSEMYSHDIYGLIALQVAGRHYEGHCAANPDYSGTSSCRDAATDHRAYKSGKNNEGTQLNNESRIGWRGFAHFSALPRDVLFIWQVEAGYVDPSFSNQNGSYIGNRDTFIGLENKAGFGLLRLGRVLTPLYELVDWPASNPGLGDVWDWGGSIAGVDYNDRQSDTIRWDSNELWKGFTIDVAVGAGQDRDGDTDSYDAPSNYYHGMAAHQKFNYGRNSSIQIDLAYEMNYKSDVSYSDDSGEYDNPDLATLNGSWDNQTYLMGIQGVQGFSFMNETIGYFAQYRLAKAKDKSSNNANPDQKEKGYSLGLMYNFGQDNKWQAKVGYAHLDNVEVDSESDMKTDKKAWSTQLLYSIDEHAVVYARYRDLQFEDSDDFQEASVGIEYWF